MLTHGCAEKSSLLRRKEGVRGSSQRGFVGLAGVGEKMEEEGKKRRWGRKRGRRVDMGKIITRVRPWEEGEGAQVVKFGKQRKSELGVAAV